jgi:hypothetical protein
MKDEKYDKYESYTEHVCTYSILSHATPHTILFSLQQVYEQGTRHYAFFSTSNATETDMMKDMTQMATWALPVTGTSSTVSNHF